jgi:hypothetical protein
MTKQEFFDTVVELNTQSVEVFKGLVDQIDEPQSVTITRDQLDTIVYEIVKNLSALGTDILSSYELSMGYHNQVELDDVQIDESEIEDIIKSVIENELDINED